MNDKKSKMVLKCQDIFRTLIADIFCSICWEWLPGEVRKKDLAAKTSSHHTSLPMPDYSNGFQFLFPTNENGSQRLKTVIWKFSFLMRRKCRGSAVSPLFSFDRTDFISSFLSCFLYQQFYLNESVLAELATMFTEVSKAPAVCFPNYFQSLCHKSLIRTAAVT